MKATQDNAEWVSNTYKQGATEDNWAAVKATVRSPKIPHVIESATTTSATVHAPYGSPSATADYILYNPTDGEVPFTVSVNNNVATTLSGDSFTLQNSTNLASYFDGVTNASCGIFTADGSYAYFKSGTGGFWYKIGLPSPFKIVNTSNTLDSTFQLTSLASEDDTDAMMVSYAAGGNYIYLWGRGQVVARYTLTTPYLMETATDLQTYDLTSYLDSLYTSNKDKSGFVGFKVSADGTKGMSCVKLWGNTNGNAYIPNYAQGFTLSTPFDLSTIQLTSEGNPLQYDGNNRFSNAFNFSESGDFISGVVGDYQSAPYYRSYYLSTPWDVSSASQVTSEYINTFYSGSDFYNEQISFLYNPVDNDVYVTSSNPQHYYDTNGLLSSGNPYPTSTLSYSAAGLTVAPTAIYEDSVTSSDIKVATITRADADQEGKSLVVSKESTATSLVVYPPSDAQGSTALNNKKLKIDGAEFTVSSTTFTDDVFSTLNASVSSARSGNTRGSDAESTARFVGAFQFDNPATRPGVTPATYTNSMGMAFNNDGTKFFVQGYQDNPNFSTLGGPSTGTDEPLVEWDLSTPWDISTATYSNIYDGGDFRGESPSLSLNAESLDFAFSDDGTIMYVMHNSSATSYLFQGTLSKPFDPSTWTYSKHISLYSLFANLNYIYSFAISNDGRAIGVFYSSSAGTLTSDSYTKSKYIQLATPWDISSATDKGSWSSYGAYRSSLFGDSQYGYSSFGVSRSASNNFSEYLNVGSLSADLTNKQAMADQAFDMSLIENWVDNIYANEPAGKTIVVDGGTKMYVHIPEEHRVAMFTGAFGNFADKHVIDITSLGLSGPQPKHVEFAAPATFTSMGSTSLLSNTNLYKEYATSEVSIDAEALKFKIEGDTGATVTRFNADLFT